MQISDIARQYAGTTSSPEAMTGTRGIEKLVSSIRDLTAGNIFEGTVNSVKNGQAVIGLSNGTLLTARLDANMQLLQGQSMFFQVKSNNGETIAIRPYTMDGNGVNLTLLNALNTAGLPVTDKNLNLVNNMMQQHMPIDKNTLSQMARILMANPDMSVNTLVQMKKLDIPVTSEMVAQFENYVDDSSAVHKQMDSFIRELPVVMEGKDMPLEQLKAFDSQLLSIIADGMELQSGGQAQSVELEQPQVGAQSQVGAYSQSGEQIQTGVQSQMAEQVQHSVQPEVSEQVQDGVQSQMSEQVQIAVPVQNTESVQVNGQIQAGEQTQAAEQLQVNTEQTQAVEKQQANDQLHADTKMHVISQEHTKENVVRFVTDLFGDTGIVKEDTPVVVLNKLSHFIMTGENVSKESLQALFSSKDMQQLLKDAMEGQMYLSPEEVADGEKVKKLYERLESKSQRLEALLNQAGLQETPLAQTVQQVRGNIEFMNQINQAYTYVQIPLKMSGQNASGQLYVYTNKRDIKDPEKELTAFLHLDLDHLGSTDVSVKMLHKKVDTKFYMETDEAFELVKAHMEELEERLKLKGFDAKIYVENEGKKVNFLDDFLKKDTPPTGQLHRYSFDVRA